MKKQHMHGDAEKLVSDLVLQWDPNRDGTVSRMEFRQNVRKLFSNDTKIDVKEVDALFARLDADHSGEMDTREVKAALKKLIQGTVGASAPPEAAGGSTEASSCASAELKEQGLAQIVQGDERSQAAQARGSPTFGLQWRCLLEKPDDGVALDNAPLQRALASKTEFTVEEFDAFNIDNLLPSHFVSCNRKYYQPVPLLRSASPITSAIQDDQPESEPPILEVGLAPALGPVPASVPLTASMPVPAPAPAASAPVLESEMGRAPPTHALGVAATADGARKSKATPGRKRRT